MEAQYQGAKLGIQGAAGTFLVVLGAAIVIAGLFKPMSFERKTRYVTPEGEFTEEEMAQPARGMPDSILRLSDSLRRADSAAAAVRH